jgi:hypothetical protein
MFQRYIQLPTFIFLLLICIAVGAGVLALSSDKRTGKKRSSVSPATQSEPADSDQVYSYRLQKSLFTPAELVFFNALQEATSGQFLVFGKVRVADVIKPQTSNRSDWQRAFNKISAKHFDFVLCDKESLKVLATVELDDSSHSRVDRVKRDDFLNQAVDSAKLALIRFPVQASYGLDDIQSKIAQTLG